MQASLRNNTNYQYHYDSGQAYSQQAAFDSTAAPEAQSQLHYQLVDDCAHFQLQTPSTIIHHLPVENHLQDTSGQQSRQVYYDDENQYFAQQNGHQFNYPQQQHNQTSALQPVEPHILYSQQQQMFCYAQPPLEALNQNEQSTPTLEVPDEKGVCGGQLEYSLYTSQQSVAVVVDQDKHANIVDGSEQNHGHDHQQVFYNLQQASTPYSQQQNCSDGHIEGETSSYSMLALAQTQAATIGPLESREQAPFLAASECAPIDYHILEPIQSNHQADIGEAVAVASEDIRFATNQVHYYGEDETVPGNGFATERPMINNSASYNSSSASNFSSSSDLAESLDSTLTRDEKKAREANIPLSYFEIVNLSIDQFNEHVSRFSFTEAQLTLMKDIRRRGKNKVAAQTCRKRKMEQISELQHEVNQLVERKLALNYERNNLEAARERLLESYEKIYSVIKRHLNNVGDSGTQVQTAQLRNHGPDDNRHVLAMKSPTG